MLIFSILTFWRLFFRKFVILSHLNNLRILYIKLHSMDFFWSCFKLKFKLSPGVMFSKIFEYILLLKYFVFSGANIITSSHVDSIFFIYYFLYLTSKISFGFLVFCFLIVSFFVEPSFSIFAYISIFF